MRIDDDDLVEFVNNSPSSSRVRLMRGGICGGDGLVGLGLCGRLMGCSVVMMLLLKMRRGMYR